jgi:flagellar biosynthesis chaperone FliJ
MIVIESVIQTNALGRWYIELSDTMKEESVEDNLMICLDINEYAQKIELMGKEYDGEVEVTWSSGEGVTVEQINEVRQQIMTYEAEVEAKNSEATHMSDGTPNFSS